MQVMGILEVIVPILFGILEVQIIIWTKVLEGVVCIVVVLSLEVVSMEGNKSNADISVKEKSVLIYSIFVAGLCSIVYELLISTASSYFLGDSIKQFSITIGLYMASMGIGAYISRNFEVLIIFIININSILYPIFKSHMYSKHFRTFLT